MSRTLLFGRRAVRLAGFALIVAPFALSTLSGSVASAQEVRTITVILTEYKFNPSSITLTVGQPVQLNIQNQGGADHSLLSDIAVTQVHYEKADNTKAELQSYEANNVINADVGSGHTSVVLFTPSKAGSFEFHSEDEESLGLLGTFVVVTPGGESAAPAAAATAPSSATTSATVARDGQSLSGQPSSTQAMFTAVWGDRAAQQWATEHNAALSR